MDLGKEHDGASHLFRVLDNYSSVATAEDFRRDLAFAHLTDEMVERLRPYSVELCLPAGTILYTYGDSTVDIFVVLEGAIDVSLRVIRGEPKVFSHLEKNEFTGEFNVLNCQRSVGEARTVHDSRVLRMTKRDLQRLMRAEGDIANLIVSAVIWRRIGVMAEPSTGLILMGFVGDAELLQLQRFLTRNFYPFRLVETTAEELSPACSIAMPAAILLDGRVLSKPTIVELADELGLTQNLDPQMIYDVAVVGAGPSGLAAAVYASSEGLSTIVVEGLAPGGQAGTSSKIENYLGFPSGISGQRLASRALLQALKFGVHFAISRNVVACEQIEELHNLKLAGGTTILAKAVVVASGAQYRKLSVDNYGRFENCGLYYAATAMESVLCRDREIIVVGGGNSAGQAAVFLSGIAKHVYHIVRSSSLASTMSQYLVARIESSPKITLCADSEITDLDGDNCLEAVTWINRKTGAITSKSIRSVFVMIGAEPNSGWLYGTVKLDNKGFIVTGGQDGFETTPYATSHKGIYAVGDVRSRSLKRVASAVGEGSVVISDVHHYLADGHSGVPPPSNSSLAALRNKSESSGR